MPLALSVTLDDALTMRSIDTGTITPAAAGPDAAISNSSPNEASDLGIRRAVATWARSSQRVGGP
jgi:hypothetical protein